MGCCSSSACRGVFRKKTKKESKKGKKDFKEINSLQDGSRKVALEELGTSLYKLHEQHEQHFRTLQEALKAAGTKERERLMQATYQQLGRLLWEITEKVKADTTADLNVVYEKKLMTNTEEHQVRTEELKKAHDQEKQSLREDFEAVQASLQAKADELTADLKRFNELKQSLDESSLRTYLQGNIQTLGSPGAFWERELESLLFVIEMKSTQLQDQCRKLEQAEMLVEKNAILENQVQRVVQQKEELEARISSYQTLIEHLSKEHESLKDARSKESLLIQKLSQEKEELLYKLLQQNAGFSLHRSPMTPQLTPTSAH